MADKLQNNQVKELKSYLNFFHQKRDETFKEIDLDFKDYIQDNLQDSSIFNKEDVEDLITKWNDQVKKTLSNDLSKMNRMSAIYLQYLFQQTGVEFSLNLNLLEDIKMIESMKKVETSDVAFSSSADQKQSIKAVAGKLPSLFESQKTDQNLMKIDQLEEENARLKNELKLLSEKCGVSQQEKQGTSEDLSDLTQKYEQLSIEYKLLQDESHKKLNESAQFNNLKKMIQQKNEQLKEVKDRQINLQMLDLNKSLNFNQNSLSKYEKVE